MQIYSCDSVHLDSWLRRHKRETIIHPTFLSSDASEEEITNLVFNWSNVWHISLKIISRRYRF